MAYDLDGNVVGKSAGATSWGYSYDFEDRLVNASLNGQPVQSNLYDGSDDRVMATLNGSSVVYAYEGNNILYEKNLTTGAVTDHFYVGRLQLAKLSSSSPYYYHFDALGSIRLVTNSGGINAFSTNYLPYGIAYNTTGMETFMYTDKPVDASTGLYYFGARFYDSFLFRFVSKDADLGSTDDPLSLNLYSYARENPQMYVDANGHSWTLMRTDVFTPRSFGDWLWNVYFASPSGWLAFGSAVLTTVFALIGMCLPVGVARLSVMFDSATILGLVGALTSGDATRLIEFLIGLLPQMLATVIMSATIIQQFIIIGRIGADVLLFGTGAGALVAGADVSGAIVFGVISLGTWFLSVWLQYQTYLRTEY